MALRNKLNARREMTPHLQSAVIKRSVIIAGHKTSVSLEDAFWGDLKEIAHSRAMTLSGIVGQISAGRDHGNLSSTIRLFVLEHARAQWQTANAAVAQPGSADRTNSR